MTTLYFNCEKIDLSDEKIAIDFLFKNSSEDNQSQKIVLKRKLEDYNDDEYGLLISLNDEVKISPLNELIKNFETRKFTKKLKILNLILEYRY